MAENRSKVLTASDAPDLTSPAETSKISFDGPIESSIRSKAAATGVVGDGEGILPRSIRPTRGQTQGSSKATEAEIYKNYRRLMDSLLEELDKAQDYVSGEFLEDEGASVTAEVEHLLGELWALPWGQGESLKLVVTIMQIPTRNARWTPRHVCFLQEAARLLRVQYLIDASTVEWCKELLRSHGFDLFRGSVTEPEVIRRYRIVEEVPE